MCLTTGVRITRDRWTDLPMPHEVIHRVTEMGRQQGMPTTLTFADRHGQELEDRLVEVPDDDSTQEAYDPHYDDDSEHTGEDDLSYDTSDEEDDNDDDDDDDDDPHAPVPLPIDGGGNDDDDDDDPHVPDPVPNGQDEGNAFAPDPPILDNDPVIFGAAFPPIDLNEEEHPNNPMSTGVGEASVDAADIINIDDTEESTGVEYPNNTGVDKNVVPMVETMVDDEEFVDGDTTRITE